MRIALVALHFAEYASRLALALAQGHEVLLVLRRDNADAELIPALRTRVTKKVRLVLVEHRMLRDPRVLLSTLRIVREVQRFAPDVVHFQEYPADYTAGAWWLLRRRYPVVLTVHDYVAHSGADSKLPARKRRYQETMRRSARHIIVHGESIREQVLRLEGRSAEEVSAVPHGVLGADPEEKFVEPPETPNLLFFGRIEAYKGLGILLEALSSLRDLPGLTLTIAGSGSDLERHRAVISGDSRIRLIDRYVHAEEVPHLFQQCTIAVMPYVDATQSGVAALAFAFGRPVIASRTGALPEVVRDGVNGMIVPPGDAFELAVAIRALLSNHDLLSRLTQGALRFARESLNWGGVAEQTLMAYALASSPGLVSCGEASV